MTRLHHRRRRLMEEFMRAVAVAGLGLVEGLAARVHDFIARTLRLGQIGRHAHGQDRVGPVLRGDDAAIDIAITALHGLDMLHAVNHPAEHAHIAVEIARRLAGDDVELGIAAIGGIIPRHAITPGQCSAQTSLPAAFMPAAKPSTWPTLAA